ncbi:PqqD family peptide modification chaperone [Sphingomonas sp.]|jgi:hypothetical protein|uniref:PqqD family peptide modification chaperone n=1 Tax=Sphingomonas sp. TaxID=28214 RepID=UPI002E36CE74|nr:PqqD family peptide modification chaperone [Sphingomonas sp.]HEX4695936.1 PqqD family peptide modification chaperone [Sphingomonas sp.]
MIHREGDWLSAKVGDQLVMMSASEGKYLSLSEVGARIWELIETPKSREDLCATLVTEYDVTPEQCRREVDDFLAMLAKESAARIDAAA